MKQKFTSGDLHQITYESLEKRNKSELIDLTLRLRNFTTDLYERINQDSTNSSKPPSSDNPFRKANKKDTKDDINRSVDKDRNDIADDSAPSLDQEQNESNDEDSGIARDKKDKDKRKPGRQPGAQGFGRNEKPIPDHIEHHYPKQCIICNCQLDNEEAVLHTGFYTYELERNPEDKPHAIIIGCTLHYYYSRICSCGHKNVECPGSGYESLIEGRVCNIKLSEYTLVGPMLAAFIASLNRDYGMSRKKIRDYLQTWFKFELSTGMICRTIREAGIACYPVVDELIEQLQEKEQVHLDETTWKEKGVLLWVWVGITANIAVYLIGSRKKEMLLQLITEAFMGWIITDGYGVYRDYEKRQRCLAHLIRKAVALSGAVDEQAQKMGDWFLNELRRLIKEMADGQAGKNQCNPTLARLKRACNLGAESEHAKLKSLAREILNDWDAVVAFVKNPELPATNNLAERALRWVVLYRKITFGTRTSEGSKSFAATLSVVKTCRLRNIDPWDYVAQTIARARKGLAPLTIG